MVFRSKTPDRMMEVIIDQINLESVLPSPQPLKSTKIIKKPWHLSVFSYRQDYLSKYIFCLRLVLVSLSRACAWKNKWCFNSKCLSSNETPFSLIFEEKKLVIFFLCLTLCGYQVPNITRPNLTPLPLLFLRGLSVQVGTLKEYKIFNI